MRTTRRSVLVYALMAVLCGTQQDGSLSSVLEESNNFQRCQDRYECPNNKDEYRPPVWLPADPSLACCSTMSAYALQLHGSRRERDKNGHFVPLEIVKEEDDKPEPDARGEQRMMVHFLWLSKANKKPLSLLIYLAVRAAYIRLNPHVIYLHVDGEPVDSPYWRMVKPMLSKVVMWSNLHTVFGQKIHGVEHKTDVLRLRALQKYGGVYLDTDIIAMRSLDELLQHPKGTVMGIQSNGKLCNAVIITRRNSTFLGLWMETYRTDFRDRVWAYNSVVIPWRLSGQHPDALHRVAAEKFFRPLYTEKARFFNTVGPGEEDKLFQFKDNLLLHMWGRAFRRKYLSKVSVDWIMMTRNALNRILRPLLPNPFITVVLKGPVTARTLASLKRQSFALWEAVGSSQVCGAKEVPQGVRCKPRIDGAWKIELESGKELSGDFLEKVVKTIGRDSKSFELAVDEVAIKFAFRTMDPH